MLVVVDAIFLYIVVVVVVLVALRLGARASQANYYFSAQPIRLFLSPKASLKRLLAKR